MWHGASITDFAAAADRDMTGLIRSAWDFIAKRTKQEYYSFAKHGERHLLRVRVFSDTEGTRTNGIGSHSIQATTMIGVTKASLSVGGLTS
jgi:hypothetical protein